MPSTDVMNYVFCIIYLSLNCKQLAISDTNLQLLQPAGIRQTRWQNVLKIHKYCRNYHLLLSISSGQFVLWREQLVLEDTKRGFLRSWIKHETPRAHYSYLYGEMSVKMLELKVGYWSDWIWTKSFVPSIITLWLVNISAISYDTIRCDKRV